MVSVWNVIQSMMTERSHRAYSNVSVCKARLGESFRKTEVTELHVVVLVKKHCTREYQSDTM